MRALVTGATGFIGGRLSSSLVHSGVSVRCLVRDPAKAQHLKREGCELHRGDVTDAGSLEGAGSEIDVAYFLIHAMAGGQGFEQREHEGALNFAQMAKREGIKRVIYLGGLGDESVSKHLQSRNETALLLAENGPALTYFRAAMVVGAQSESYRTLRYLVRRLPVMIAPSWLNPLMPRVMVSRKPLNRTSPMKRLFWPRYALWRIGSWPRSVPMTRPSARSR